MKKAVLFAVSAAFALQSVFAQIFVPSANQQLIERAVRDGIMLLRQEYQLEDTVSLKRYTRDNRPEFGSGMSFCVATDRGYVLSDEALRPWSYDRDFDAYRDGRFRPVVSKTLCRTAADSTWRVLPTLDCAAGLPLQETQWRLAADTSSAFRGFAADTTAGEKEGWLVWLTAEEPDRSDPGDLSLVIYRHRIAAGGGERIAIPAPTTRLRAVGGVYVVPQYPEPGTVVFALTGIVVGDGDEWRLLRIPAAGTPDRRGVTLTPVESDAETADGEDVPGNAPRRGRKNK